MPADIRYQIERVIKTTLDDYWQAHSSPFEDGRTDRSQEAPLAEEHFPRHLDRVLCEMEERATHITGESQRSNTLAHESVAVNYQDGEKRTQCDSHLDQVSSVLGRLEKLQIQLEAFAVQQSPADLSVSALLAADGNLRADGREKSELVLQSVDHFLNGAFNLVRAVM